MIANVVSRIGTPKIIIGTIKEKTATFLNSPITASELIIYPKNKDPVSPIKIFAGLKLYFRNPSVLPSIIKPSKATVGFPIEIASPENVSKTMEDTPAAKPSKPSIRLIALVIATIHRIVSGMAKYPNSTILPAGSVMNSIFIPPRTVINAANS